MPPNPPPAASTGRRLLVGLALLSLVAACGGGGGGAFTPPEPPEPDPDGITGTIRAPGVHLGRMAEREPNDQVGQAYRLPPVFARSRLEVVGNLGLTAGLYGAPDPQDVLRFTCLADADVTLTLDYGAVDPVGGGPNAFEAAVRTVAPTTLLTLAGPGPQSGVFPCLTGQVLLVTLTATLGHGPWRLTFACSDLPAAPKPGAVPARLAARSAPAADAVVPATCADDHVLVRLKAGVDPAAFAAAHGLTLGARTALGSWRMGLAPAAPADGPAKAVRSAAALTGDDDVVLSEPDWVVHTCGTAGDADFARQWALRAIGAPEAWDETQGSSSVVVGIVDTGLVDHPDLQGQVVDGYDFITDPAVAGDGSGRDPDPTDRGDAALSSGLSSWHGTHVAAIVAARADANGVVGVAPGCRVMALRALGRGGGLSSDVADAILYAAGQYTTPDGRRLQQPLRIVNLSLGSANRSVEIENACTVAANQGVLLVAAAGNDGGSVAYPAAFPTVMAVGAVDGLLDGTLYSNHGAEVSVCAPGGTTLKDLQGDGWPDSILSALVDQTRHPSVKAVGFLQGTSQAAPHVAGTAALLLSLDPTLTPQQLRQRIEDSALDRGPVGVDVVHGHGLVQAHAALKRWHQDHGQPLGPPALHLPIGVVRFVGLESARSVPVDNAGGGTLEILGAQITTDDGSSWLAATLVPNFPGAECNVARIDLGVDRFALPPDPAWYSATVRLYAASGPLGLLRVVVAVGLWPRAGSPFRVVALDQAQLGVHADGWAHPQFDYRYWLRGLAPDTYLLKAGDDLDFDGFFCEPFDLCGWFGGDDAAGATPLVLLSGTAFTGTDFTIR